MHMLVSGSSAYPSCNSETCRSLEAPSSGGQRLALNQTRLPAKSKTTAVTMQTANTAVIST